MIPGPAAQQPYCLFPLCDAAKSNKRKWTTGTGRVLGQQWNWRSREGGRQDGGVEREGEAGEGTKANMAD